MKREAARKTSNEREREREGPGKQKDQREALLDECSSVL